MDNRDLVEELRECCRETLHLLETPGDFTNDEMVDIWDRLFAYGYSEDRNGNG